MSIKTALKKIVQSIFYLCKSEKKIAIPSQINTTEMLSGKIALITGGSGDIGMAIAESFLKNGAKVIIAGTKKEKLEFCVEKLNFGGAF